MYVKKFLASHTLFNKIDKNTFLIISSVLLSANIAFFLAQSLNSLEGYWSVVSVAAVSTGRLDKTLDKIISRLLSTLIGALYAYLVTIYLSHHYILMLLFIMLGVLLFSILILQKNALSYGGIIGSLTIVIIFEAGLTHHDFYNIAVARTVQVCLGIIISTLIHMIVYRLFSDKKLFSKTLKIKFSEQYQAFKILSLERSILVTSFKIIIAAIITSLPWLYFHYPDGVWATISCFFIIEENIDQTRKKAGYRFFATFFAAIFGLVSVLVIGEHRYLLCLPMTLGLGICAYMLAEEKSYSHLGTTMAISLCIMLLANPGESNSIFTILMRFLNISFGVSVGILLTFTPGGTNLNDNKI